MASSLSGQDEPNLVIGYLGGQDALLCSSELRAVFRKQIPRASY